MPQAMFRDNLSYSKFDENGIPTHDAGYTIPLFNKINKGVYWKINFSVYASMFKTYGICMLVCVWFYFILFFIIYKPRICNLILYQPVNHWPSLLSRNWKNSGRLKKSCTRNSSPTEFNVLLRIVSCSSYDNQKTIL